MQQVITIPAAPPAPQPGAPQQYSGAAQYYPNQQPVSSKLQRLRRMFTDIQCTMYMCSFPWHNVFVNFVIDFRLLKFSSVKNLESQNGGHGYMLCSASS